MAFVVSFLYHGYRQQIGRTMNPKVVKRIHELRTDSQHGAGWLSRQAISTLILAVNESQAHTVTELSDEISAVAAELIQARPAMISVANYVQQFLHQILLGTQNEKNLDSLKSSTEIKGNELIRSSEQAASKAAEYACGIISDTDVLISCSYSATVCRAFEIAKRKGTRFHVLVAESRFRGKAYGQIAAKQLEQRRIPVQLVPDKSIDVRVYKADKALVGADSILADGSLINGATTFRLAQAAKGQNIPFYTVCETAKFDTGHIAKASKPEPGFDKTPPELITGIITEKGTIEPSLVTAYVEEITGRQE